jgi:rubrerythrin
MDVLLILVFGGSALVLAIFVLIAPLYIRKHTRQTAEAVAKLTATQDRIVTELERLNAQAARHSNAEVPCPDCGKTIVLTDGRGTCPACQTTART